MAAHGEVVLAWGDGEHTFNISKIGQALELQDKCGGVGVATIFNRLRNGTFFFNDFRETIRLSLVGGGKSPMEALLLTKRYVDERPWTESVLTATAIITAAMVGVPQETVGKKKARRKTATKPPKMTGGSSDPISTAAVPPSTSPPDKSTNLPSGN